MATQLIVGNAGLAFREASRVDRVHLSHAGLLGHGSCVPQQSLNATFKANYAVPAPVLRKEERQMNSERLDKGPLSMMVRRKGERNGKWES